MPDAMSGEMPDTMFGEARPPRPQVPPPDHWAHLFTPEPTSVSITAGAVLIPITNLTVPVARCSSLPTCRMFIELT